MSGIARGMISVTYLFISFPFGIIFMLMCFTIFKNVNTTGMVYVKGLFDYIFVYILLNFLLSFLMGTTLIYVRKPNPTLVKTVTVLTFILLLHDIPPIKALIEDWQAGVPIGIPWPALLAGVHLILFAALIRIVRRKGRAI
jgi:hypothetical protein